MNTLLKKLVFIGKISKCMVLFDGMFWSYLSLILKYTEHKKSFLLQWGKKFTTCFPGKAYAGDGSGFRTGELSREARTKWKSLFCLQNLLILVNESCPETLFIDIYKEINAGARPRNASGEHPVCWDCTVWFMRRGGSAHFPSSNSTLSFQPAGKESSAHTLHTYTCTDV